MRSQNASIRSLAVGFVALGAALRPVPARACACGCDAFDVQTSAIMPTSTGATAFLEMDALDQNQNWSGGSKAPSDQNSDKQIRTGFFTLGAQYMFSRSWGVEGELPYWSRNFKTESGAGIGDFTHSAVGDARVRAIYSGLSSDMSAGLTLGLKLPTGDMSAPDFDRDTQPGTGSTDALLGGYETGVHERWGWFADAELDEPALIAAGYRPGAEIDGAAGAYARGWTIGGVEVEPLAQAVASWRWRDSGPAADSADTGFRRLAAGPGVQVNAGLWGAFATVAFPIDQYYNGNQLAAPELWKLMLTRKF